MKALFLIGSLKSDYEESNTVKLCSLVSSEFKEAWGVESKLLYLRNFRMSHGVERDTGDEWDEFGSIYDEMETANIIIMATPIWWGIQSSLISQAMERLGAYDDEYIKSGTSALYNKVFGCVITASNDGFQQVQGNLYAFASNLGMTVPPEAHITWGTVVGSPENPVDNPETMNMMKNACRNLYLWAHMMEQSRLGDTALQIEPGRVGLDSDDKLRSSE